MAAHNALQPHLDSVGTWIHICTHTHRHACEQIFISECPLKGYKSSDVPLLLKLWIHLKIQPFFINKTSSPHAHSWFICFILCIEVQLITKCVLKFSPFLLISCRVCCILESSPNDISNKSLCNDFEIWSCCFIIYPFLLFLYFIPLTHLFLLLLCGYYPDHIFNLFLFSIFFSLHKHSDREVGS